MPKKSTKEKTPVIRPERAASGIKPVCKVVVPVSSYPEVFDNQLEALLKQANEKYPGIKSAKATVLIFV